MKLKILKNNLGIKVKKIPLFFLIVLLLINTTSPKTTYAYSRSISNDVTNSITIGEFEEIMLFGYTSPSSTVVLETNSLSSITVSRKNGYFEFKNTAIPVNSKELCLSSIDITSLVTQPTCIPFGSALKIGPILLSPTIETKADKEKVQIIGHSIPNISINLVYADEKNTIENNYTLAKLDTISNNDGEYSFLSSNKYIEPRVYTTGLYNNNNLPKSNAIALQKLDEESYIIRLLKALINPNRLLFYILLAEGLILLKMILDLLLKRIIQRKYALCKYLYHLPKKPQTFSLEIRKLHTLAIIQNKLKLYFSD